MRPLLRSHGLEDPDVPAAARAARELRGCQNRSHLRQLGVHRVRGRFPTGRPSDPPGIEELRAASCAVAASASTASASLVRSPELEHLAARDEEGPILTEERLERGEVHDRGVDLYLSEVGIHRGVQGEIRREPVLEVQTAVGEVVGAVPERVVECYAVGVLDGGEIGSGRRVR